MAEQPNKRLIKSYVWHGEQCFFVSTIERNSSAALNPYGRYAETIAWKHDWATDTRGEQVAMEGEGAPLTQHFEVCRQLFTKGFVDFELDS